MSKNLREHIYNNLNLKETEELIEIWTTNDHVEWSATTFDVLKEILEQRLGEVPSQNEPVLEHVKPEFTPIFYENLPLDEFSNPDNEPIFYEPKEVLWINNWLNRAAKAAIIITILVSIPEIINLHRIVFSYFLENREWSLVSWLITLIVGGLETAFICFIVYFSLKALASILKILMEMEFKSRVVK